MSKRIIYYYQTFIGLKDILIPNTKVTHIHLSSIHFGTDNNNNPYIHLNDNNPSDPIFDSVWSDLKEAKKLGIKIILMVGGAGGAFQTLFSNYNTYYNLLKNLIYSKKDIIDGIDLDIEEQVSITNVENLIKTIKTDFGSNFIVTMAPIQSSMQSDQSGMGGFIYKDLYKSCGSYIDYFNVQCYYDYSVNAYKEIINNGYPVEKIVMGSISSQDITQNINTIKNIVQIYPNIGGVFNWEYYDSPTLNSSYDGNHGTWSQLMYEALSIV
jgi:chitinase